MVLSSCICNSCCLFSLVVPGHVPYILFAILLNFTFLLFTYTQNASSILVSYLILNLSTRSEKLNIFVKGFLLNQYYPSFSTSYFNPECITLPFISRSTTFSDFSILSHYSGSHITNVDDPVLIMIRFFILIACKNP